MNNQNIDLLISPREFFHEKITEASKHLKVSLDEHVEFYLVNLLADKVNASSLSSTSPTTDDFLSTPLAFMLKNALEAPTEHQSTLYRRLGDASLYVSGFFQDFFNRKTFDINYYITMGANAYSQASAMSRNSSKEDVLSETFDCLARNFIQIVDVVAQASDTTAMVHDSSILILYDRWNRSGSERLRNLLENKGINPIKVPYKQAQ